MPRFRPVRLFASCALLALAGCAVTHPVVPVVGETGTVAALAGVWEGTYRSADSGRAGAIHFALTGATDTTGAVAEGEVVMTHTDGIASFSPPDPGQPHERPTPRMGSEVLTIRFVRLDGGRVSGTLDPYTDPACGCRLSTTFEGVLADGVIEGTFAAQSSEHGHLQRGTWRVVRQP